MTPCVHFGGNVFLLSFYAFPQKNSKKVLTRRVRYGIIKTTHRIAPPSEISAQKNGRDGADIIKSEDT